MARHAPEEYASVGFDFDGYLEPEVSADGVFPDYLAREVSDVVERVQRCQGYDTVTFGFMTDCHYAVNFRLSHQIRLRRLLETYRRIADQTGCAFLTICGDLFANGSKRYVSDCLRALRTELSGIRYFPVNGNHDDNSIWDISFLHAVPAVNHLLPEERYVLFFNHMPAQGAVFHRAQPGLYYYLDDASARLRHIVLDTGDIPYRHGEDGGLLYNGQHMYAYSQAQLDWLTREALRFPEAGWTAVLYQHVPARSADENPNEDYSHLQVLRDILRARRENQLCSVQYGQGDFRQEVRADFSQAEPCRIAAVFSGHEHMDSGVTVDGIPHIVTANSVFYRGGNPLPRSDGEKSELLMDIVTLSPGQRTLYLTRVGAGQDRIFRY